MGKATQRRERRLAQDLQSLFTRNPDHFVRVWDLYLRGWCEEVAARARALKHGATESMLGSVFGVLEKAERLLRLIGADAEHLVGPRTRQILLHECCKAVAKATDPRIFLFENDSVYRLMETKTVARR